MARRGSAAGSARRCRAGRAVTGGRALAKVKKLRTVRVSNDWGGRYPAINCPGCDPGQMALHTNVWIVAGTAAPVIALANVVTVSDFWGLLGALARSGAPRAESAAERSVLLYMLSGINLFAQALVMLWALLSLDWNRDVVSPIWPIVITFIGLLLVLFTTLLASGLRWLRDQVIHYDQPGAPPCSGPEPAGSSLESPAPPPRAGG